MKKLTPEDYHEIRIWIYRNARPIELALWQYHFEHGSKEAVLSALSFYQNDDGGFGHALEPDNWNPNSTIYTTLNAISVLKEIDFSDDRHPILKGIFRFLENGVYCSENGWDFNIPSNNDYAHAPWWTFNPEADITENIGLTAEIAAFIYSNAAEDSGLYKKAVALSDFVFNKLGSQEHYGDMGIRGYCLLFDSIEKSDKANRYDCSRLKEKLAKSVYDSIERDTSKWIHYSARPSEYIFSPESIFYKDNEDIVCKELDYLLETRPKNGVWNITWTWFDNNEKYAKEFAISENWWKAKKAVENVKWLEMFGRIEK